MRAIVGLAIRTSIPVQAWLQEDPAVITTALDLIEEADDQ